MKVTPHFEWVQDEKGGTLILVLVISAALSFFLLMLSQYSLWGAEIKPVIQHRETLYQARRAGIDLIQHRLKETLSETEPLRTKTFHWKLSDVVSIRAKVNSLNNRLNPNVLKHPDPDGNVHELFEKLLTRAGYPPRTVDEIEYWITPESSLDVNTNRYAGYPYEAPGRSIRHFDELKLISGIRQLGIKPVLRKFFTVHGTGNWNIQHLTRSQWQLVQSTLLQDQNKKISTLSLNEFHKQLEETNFINSIRDKYPFVTTSDDSFKVHMTVSAGGAKRHFTVILIKRSDSLTVEKIFGNSQPVNKTDKPLSS
ncbi:MAG: hypothetical protein ABEJ65_09190 [bacterium]